MGWIPSSGRGESLFQRSCQDIDPLGVGAFNVKPDDVTWTEDSPDDVTWLAARINYKRRRLN
jgi:hypothetical protein